MALFNPKIERLSDNEYFTNRVSYESASLAREKLAANVSYHVFSARWQVVYFVYDNNARNFAGSVWVNIGAEYFNSGDDANTRALKFVSGKLK